MHHGSKRIHVVERLRSMMAKPWQKKRARPPSCEPPRKVAAAAKYGNRYRKDANSNTTPSSSKTKRPWKVKEEMKDEEVKDEEVKSEEEQDEEAKSEEAKHEEVDYNGANSDNSWRATAHDETRDVDDNEDTRGLDQQVADALYDKTLKHLWFVFRNGPATPPATRLSYSASVKALEVEIRGLTRAAIEQLISSSPVDQSNASFGVEPPNTNPALHRRAANVRGLFESIRIKTSGPAYSKTRQEDIVKLLNKMLEENLKRCAWKHVISLAHDIGCWADLMGQQCADRARETLEEILEHSPFRSAP